MRAPSTEQGLRGAQLSHPFWGPLFFPVRSSGPRGQPSVPGGRAAGPGRAQTPGVQPPRAPRGVAFPGGLGSRIPLPAGSAVAPCAGGGEAAGSGGSGGGGGRWPSSSGHGECPGSRGPAPARAHAPALARGARARAPCAPAPGLPHAAGARQPHGQDRRLHQCPRALCQDRRGLRHRSHRGEDPGPLAPEAPGAECPGVVVPGPRTGGLSHPSPVGRDPSLRSQRRTSQIPGCPHPQGPRLHALSKR